MAEDLALSLETFVQKYVLPAFRQAMEEEDMANTKRTHQERGRHEDPDYSRPEKHAPNNGGGTTTRGDQINGTYKQPWVEHDPVAPDDPKLG
jgi:hypothetical protein